MYVLLGRRARLEILKSCPHIVYKVPRFRCTPLPLDPLLHQGPLFVDHLLGVGAGVFLELEALSFWEPMREPGDVGYRVCLALYRFESPLILLPNSDDQECQQHGVHHPYDGVEKACNVVMLLALFGGTRRCTNSSPATAARQNP